MNQNLQKFFKKTFFYSIVLAFFLSCGLDTFDNNSEIQSLTKINYEQEQDISFILNKNLEITDEINSIYYSSMATSGKGSLETKRIYETIITVNGFNDLTRWIYNDIAKRTLLILISSHDANTSMDDFENIEEAILTGDEEAQMKLNLLNEKIDRLNINIQGNDGFHEDNTNNLFHIDQEGYINLKSLYGYLNKNDYQTSKKLLAGESFENIAIEGMSLMDNIHKYRNKTLVMIANHRYVDMYGNEIDYEIDTNSIETPSFLRNDDDFLRFDQIIDSTLDQMIKNNKINSSDKEILKAVLMKITKPNYTMQGGERIPWLYAQFKNSIIGSTVNLTSLRMDILQTQNLVLTHLLSKISIRSY